MVHARKCIVYGFAEVPSNLSDSSFCVMQTSSLNDDATEQQYFACVDDNVDFSF